MGFYSSLSLIISATPTDDLCAQIIEKAFSLGIITSVSKHSNEDYYVCDDLYLKLYSNEFEKLNERIVQVSTFTVHHGVELSSLCYPGMNSDFGIEISFHGSGYFYPVDCEYIEKFWRNDQGIIELEKFAKYTAVKEAKEWPFESELFHDRHIPVDSHRTFWFMSEG